MDDQDFGTFERAFGRASGAFRVRWQKYQQVDLARTYFRALEGYRLDIVLEALGSCVRSLRTFPKIADVLQAITITAPAAACPQDRRQLTQTEVIEQAHAHALCYQDDPCVCLVCQAAGVSTQPLRFVPTLAGDDEERAFNPQRHRVEIVGHWAHGAELRRWYDARDACYAKWRLAAVRYPHLVAVGALIGASREPGEEG